MMAPALECFCSTCSGVFVDQAAWVPVDGTCFQEPKYCTCQLGQKVHYVCWLCAQAVGREALDPTRPVKSSAEEEGKYKLLPACLLSGTCTAQCLP
jgi:hypothetical protein